MVGNRDAIVIELVYPAKFSSSGSFTTILVGMARKFLDARKAPENQPHTRPPRALSNARNSQLAHKLRGPALRRPSSRKKFLLPKAHLTTNAALRAKKCARIFAAVPLLRDRGQFSPTVGVGEQPDTAVRRDPHQTVTARKWSKRVWRPASSSASRRRVEKDSQLNEATTDP